MMNTTSMNTTTIEAAYGLDASYRTEYNYPNPKIGDLLVWWCGRIEAPAIYFPVASVDEARRVLRILGAYDEYLAGKGIRSSDYDNAGGLLVYTRYDYDTSECTNVWGEWTDDDGYEILENPDCVFRMP